MGREARDSELQTGLAQKELAYWFKTARGVTVFTPEATDGETFMPEDYGWGVSAALDGDNLVIALVLDLGRGEGGQVPIRYYAAGEWDRVEFTSPPQFLAASRIVIPDAGTISMVAGDCKVVA